MKYLNNKLIDLYYKNNNPKLIIFLFIIFIQ